MLSEALATDGKTHRQKQRRMDFYAQRGAIAIRWHWAQRLTGHLNRKIPDDSESLAFETPGNFFFLQLVVAVSCSECIVCHFYISSSCLNPSKMNLQKDCLVTCKNLQLGGLQVVTSWFVQEFEGSFT